MSNLADRKQHILQVIASLQQDEWLDALERLLAPYLQQKAFRYAKPLQQQLSLPALMNTQHYSFEKARSAFGQLAFENESYHELLSDLKA